MHELLEAWVEWIVPAIQGVGVIVVLWGVIEALLALARRAWRRLTGNRARPNLAAIRLSIGRKMVLSLEFFIASDIIQTVVIPTWESLGMLAGIVAIRTVVAYYIDYELRQGATDLDGEGHHKQA